jgi:HSP20 family molecular chaperone IbpA
MKALLDKLHFTKQSIPFPLLNIYEDKDYFYIRTFLPEKLSSLLKLSITDQTLTFIGRLVPIKDSHPLYQEVIESNIHRQVTLPEPIEQRVIARIHTEEGTEYVLKKRRL